MRGLKFKALSFAAAVILLQVRALIAYGQQPDVEETPRVITPWSNVAFDVELKGLATKLWDISEDVQKQAATDKNATAGARQAREFAGMFSSVKGNGVRLGFLRIHMEPVDTSVTAEALRAGAAELYPKSQYITKDNVKLYDYKQTPILRVKVIDSRAQDWMFLSYIGGGYSAFPTFYSVPGMYSTYSVLEAYMVRDRTGIRFSYMVPKLEEKDEQFFYTILDSIRFFDSSSPSSSYDYFTLGSELYKWKEHGKAVAALEKALALEQKKRELTQPHWRQLVMTLANALGAADDTERARDVLEYGVATEPTYPYFYHGLSRLYSYFGDLDRVLASLDKTYQYVPRDKSFLSFLRGIPDPLLDPAFRRFKDEPRFIDGVQTLKKKYKIK
jgi:tetratricopeptide (TPR) repeat protein